MNIYNEKNNLRNIKHDNVIKILLKLWELVNPNAKIKIDVMSTQIYIFMQEKGCVYNLGIDISDWNSKSADFNYTRLQNALLMLHNKFVIDYYRKGDTNGKVQK